MRYIFILILFLSSCIKQDLPTIGVQSSFETKAVHCLRDFLEGEDPNGVWSIVSIPNGSTLTSGNLTTDNPCLDFDNFGCGNYVLQYKVTTQCCSDSVQINIIKPCCSMTATITCN